MQESMFMNKKNKEPFNFQKLYRRTGLIIYDVLSIIAASYLALWLRNDLSIVGINKNFLMPVTNYMVINIVLTLIIFFIFKLYDSLWAYAGERELQNLVMACVISAVVDYIGLHFLHIPMNSSLFRSLITSTTCSYLWH